MNRIHVLLNRDPETYLRRCASELFTKIDISELRQLELPRYDRYILGSELNLLEHLQEQVKQADGWLSDIGKKDKHVKHLMSIPGIGRAFVLLVVSEIDDVKRFRSDKKLHAYAGLVPITYSSGGHTFHGGIIKNGNKYQPNVTRKVVFPQWSTILR